MTAGDAFLACKLLPRISASLVAIPRLVVLRIVEYRLQTLERTHRAFPSALHAFLRAVEPTDSALTAWLMETGSSQGPRFEPRSGRKWFRPSPSADHLLGVHWVSGPVPWLRSGIGRPSCICRSWRCQARQLCAGCDGCDGDSSVCVGRKFLKEVCGRHTKRSMTMFREGGDCERG